MSDKGRIPPELKMIFSRVLALLNKNSVFASGGCFQQSPHTNPSITDRWSMISTKASLLATYAPTAFLPPVILTIIALYSQCLEAGAHGLSNPTSM
jgi:hypothetical protein